jgi:hypothetical protein
MSAVVFYFGIAVIVCIVGAVVGLIVALLMEMFI